MAAPSGGPSGSGRLTPPPCRPLRLRLRDRHSAPYQGSRPHRSRERAAPEVKVRGVAVWGSQGPRAEGAARSRDYRVPERALSSPDARMASLARRRPASVRGRDAGARLLAALCRRRVSRRRGRLPLRPGGDGAGAELRRRHPVVPRGHPPFPAAGKVGIVSERVDPVTGKGRVLVEGEDWRAASLMDAALEPGTRVMVVRVEGATLYVDKEM